MKILAWGDGAPQPYDEQYSLSDYCLLVGTRIVDGCVQLDYDWPPSLPSVTDALRLDTNTTPIYNWGTGSNWTTTSSAEIVEGGWLGDYALRNTAGTQTHTLATSTGWQGAPQWTVAGWVRVQQEGENADCHLAVVIGGNENYVHLPHLYPSTAGSWKWQLRVRMREEGTSRVLFRSANISLQTDTWTHIAAVWDGSQLRGYVNGTQVLSSGWSAPAGLWIGNGAKRIEVRTASENDIYTLDGLWVATAALDDYCLNPGKFAIDGTVTLRTNQTAAARPVKYIDWGGEASQSAVCKVEIFDALDGTWKVVAEHDHGLVPPILVASEVWSGADAVVRLTLRSFDSMRRTTPSISWVKVVLGDAIRVIPRSLIAWGATSGAPICLSWAEYSSQDGTRVVEGSDESDDVTLAPNELFDYESAEVYVPCDYDLTNVGLLDDFYVREPTQVAWYDDIPLPGLRLLGYHPVYGGQIGGPVPDTREADVVWTACWVRLADCDVGTGSQYQYKYPLQSNLYRPGGGSGGAEYWRNQIRMSITFIGGLGFGAGCHPATPDLSSKIEVNKTVPFPADGAWHHIAAERDRRTCTMYLYVDGQCTGTQTWNTDYTVFDVLPDQQAIEIRSQILPDGRGAIIRGYHVDTKTSFGGGSFDASYFTSGSVTAVHNFGKTVRLLGIDWGGIFGSSHGFIQRVEVNDAQQGWVTVAEALTAPGVTPPLTGLSYQVSGPEIVRITLHPSEDAFSLAAPILDWLQIMVLNTPMAHSRRNPYLASTKNS